MVAKAIKIIENNGGFRELDILANSISIHPLDDEHKNIYKIESEDNFCLVNIDTRQIVG